jgi:GH43 family beta-xylosidase
MLLVKQRPYVLLFCFLFCAFCAEAQRYFTNPLLPAGADPWVIEKDGFYYYTHTTGRNIVLYKTKNLGELKDAKRKLIWEPPVGTMYSKQIWAPELHFIGGKWYFYFAADDGKNENHRLYVIENPSADPMQGNWKFLGKITDSSDKWAIDGSVFQHNKQWYITWSGWEGNSNGQQDIYIAKLKNPWTIEGRRVRISSPVLEWERHGDLNDPNNPPHVAVNEGPQLLRKGNKMFIVYSASGCWTDHYGLGMLEFTGDNLLDSLSWKKWPEPVFQTSVENKVFAPGHNSFFKSPDGKEDWIIYHANSEAGQGCGRNRSPRAQKFTWSNEGVPVFGTPVKEGEKLLLPSSKGAKKRKSLSLAD